MSKLLFPVLALALGLAAGRAPADDAAAPAAETNPLWSIGLDDLHATRERPLFSPSRRPPAVAAPLAALPVEPAPAPSAPPAPPAPPPFALIGTILGPGFRAAMVQDLATHDVSRLRPGDIISGWRAVEVGARSLILKRGDQTVVLELPKSGEASGAPEAVGGDAAPAPAARLSPAAANLARLRRQQK